MADVHDVAAYILEQHGPMSTWKLQKLVYYAQAWHLVWAEERLFPNKIQAWANGPVVYDLYDRHRGFLNVSAKEIRGDATRLSSDERGTIDAVLRGYGALTGRQLSHLTHSERPWLEARGDLDPTARSSREITPASMQEFYVALDADQGAQPVESLTWDDAPF